MPRLVNCIKNCCYTLLFTAFVCAISSLFVWQAEVYQQTIDEQVRLMKLDLSAMKKENHLMEVKLNEQVGKHEDLKEEYRYLLKQAKWPVNEGHEDEEVKRDSVDELNKMQANIVQVEQDDRLKGPNQKDILKDAMQGALDAAQETQGEEKQEEEEEIDLGKRTHIVVLSERKGGGEEVGRLLNQDEGVFYLPGISSILKTSNEFDQLAHCDISEKVVTFYKTHQALALASASLSKLCKEGQCNELTAEEISVECLARHVSVLQGNTDDWALKLIDSLSMEIAYVSRDARAIISELLEDGELTEEEVQVFASQLCARIDTFTSHSSSSHNVYEVFKYEKFAASPVTALSTLYHKLMERTDMPDLTLTKDYKNALYLSINQWQDSLQQINVDAIKEECSGLLDR